MNNKYRKVSKSEFENFIGAYPRPLIMDINRIWEPYELTWNDFTLAPKWPESIVAREWNEEYWIISDTGREI